MTAITWQELERREGGAVSVNEQRAILEIIDENGVIPFFQPLFSRRDGAVYGYEALARIPRDLPFPSIAELFAKATAAGLISSLDMLCRENSFRQAATLGLARRQELLFINICPQSLMYPAHRVGVTDQFTDQYGFPRERVVLEITEQEAIRNYQLFKGSVEHYRNRGYRIAIDDFGAGYGGLKMLSIIEPDFVKIDRHFITDIDREKVKYNLVDSITTVCHKLGIAVVAEGIERPEELAVLCELGIEYFQGYLLHEPVPYLVAESCAMPGPGPVRRHCLCRPEEICVIGDIAQPVESVAPGTPAMEVFQRFIADPGLRGIPVVDHDRVVNMLNRHRFLEQQMVGRLGFGFSLSSYKTVAEVMGRPCALLVDAATSLEEVASLVQQQQADCLYDDICVTVNGKYAGTVEVRALLEAITERSLTLARGANPLTGLPGNEFIQRTISRLLAENVHFDVGYIDIDNFKAYNDCYGFEKGDAVIRRLGEIVIRAVEEGGSDQLNFAGHIGGDDFIVVCRPRLSMRICGRVVESFKECLPEFHGRRELLRGSYQAEDRQGRIRQFPLLALSIGIVSSLFQNISSYAELAFMASGVKKAAKKEDGFTIVRDRRLQASKLHQPRQRLAGIR